MSIALWWFCSWGWTTPPEPPVVDDVYELEDSTDFYELEDSTDFYELE